MKKIVIMLAVALVLCFSSLCFAANNGSILNGEERVTAQIFDAFNNKAVYSDFAGSLSAGFAKNMPEKKFGDLRRDALQKLGTLSKPVLIDWYRFANADRLIYVAKGTKAENVQVVFVFVNENKKFMLNEILMQPVPVKKPVQQKPAPEPAEE